MLARLLVLMLCAVLQAVTPAAAAAHAAQHLAAPAPVRAESPCPEHAAQAHGSDAAPADKHCCGMQCHCVAPAVAVIARMSLPPLPPLKPLHARLAMPAHTAPALREHLRPPIAA